VVALKRGAASLALVLPTAGAIAVQNRDEIKRQVIAGRKALRSAIVVFIGGYFTTESHNSDEVHGQGQIWWL
jgi:hypothetical protein